MKILKKLSDALKKFVYWVRKDRNCPDYILIFHKPTWDRLPNGTRAWAGLERATVLEIHKDQVYVFADRAHVSEYLHLAFQYCETALDTVNKTVLKSRKYRSGKRFYNVICMEHNVELLAVCECYLNDTVRK